MDGFHEPDIFVQLIDSHILFLLFGYKDNGKVGKYVAQDRFISCRFQLFHRFAKKKRTCAANFHILFVILSCHSEFCYSIHAALRLEEFLIWHNPRQLFAAWVFVEYKL